MVYIVSFYHIILAIVPFHLYFYLVVFTAATKDYADSILSKIKIDNDGKEVSAKNLFTLKLYRSCVNSEGKDLKIVLKRLLDQRLKKLNDII